MKKDKKLSLTPFSTTNFDLIQRKLKLYQPLCVSGLNSVSALLRKVMQNEFLVKNFNKLHFSRKSFYL
jgi:hypothetical protein